VVSLWKLGWAVALLLVVVAAIALGLVMERLIILPVRLSGSRYAWIIATLAVALVFQSLFTLAYIDVPALRPQPMIDGQVALLGNNIDWQELLTIVAAVAVTIGYDLFLRRNVYGQAIRRHRTAPIPRCSWEFPCSAW
jgi:branched-chain amino acid transport system permease protein